MTLWRRAGGAVLLVATCVVPVAVVRAQTGGDALGTARLTRAVMADGEALAAGSYTLRLSSAPVAPVVGQPAEAARWIEFIQNGVVKARELATVVAPSDAARVAKGGAPASGRVRVEVLRGAEYLRVWINRGGTQYLIHLSIAR